MQDAMNTLMLVCASLASMAFGVLVAYWLCRAGFAMLRMHARSVAVQAKPVVAISSGRLQASKQVARLT